MARRSAGTSIAGPPRSVGSFVSPRTKSTIYVFPKRGESPSSAIARVRSHHGLSSVVEQGQPSTDAGLPTRDPVRNVRYSTSWTAANGRPRTLELRYRLFENPDSVTGFDAQVKMLLWDWNGKGQKPYQPITTQYTVVYGGARSNVNWPDADSAWIMPYKQGIANLIYALVAQVKKDEATLASADTWSDYSAAWSAALNNAWERYAYNKT